MISKETIVRAGQLGRVFGWQAQGLDDEKAKAVPELYPEWQADGFYEKDGIVRYEGLLYRLIPEAHAAQADWPPAAVPAVWRLISDPAVEWPEWTQPAGAHDSYAAGDRVTHGDKRWVSGVDGNVWEPGVYGWTEYDVREDEGDDSEGISE